MRCSATSTLCPTATRAGRRDGGLLEYWDTGFFPVTRDYRRYDLAADDDGPAMAVICSKAAELGINVVATIFERDGSDLCYDTAMLVGPEGRIVVSTERPISAASATS